MTDHPKGTCPLCGKEATLHRLAEHLETGHTIRELVYAVANTAVTAPAQPAEGVYRVHIPESTRAWNAALEVQARQQADDYRGFPSVADALAEAAHNTSFDPEGQP